MGWAETSQSLGVTVLPYTPCLREDDRSRGVGIPEDSRGWAGSKIGWHCRIASKAIRGIKDGLVPFSPTQQHSFRELSAYIRHLKRRLFFIF